MYKYYVDALEHNKTTQWTHDPGKPSVRHVTYRVMCLPVFVVAFNCHV